MKADKARASNANVEQSGSGDPDVTLFPLINISAKTIGISLQRLEPNREIGVKVWLDNIPFNDMISWPDDLSADNRIHINQIIIENRSPGLVDARVNLTRQVRPTLSRFGLH